MSEFDADTDRYYAGEFDALQDDEERLARVVDLPPLDELKVATVQTNRTAKTGGRSTGNDGYLTPDNFLAVLSQMGPIELDPCGDERSHIWPDRDYRLDKGEDGLLESWQVADGALVFCNPPYSQARQWIEKADLEWEVWRSNIYLLIAARTGTIALQQTNASMACFWRGRLTFVDPATGQPPKDRHGRPVGAMFDSMVLGYTDDEARFRKVFAPHGRVVKWTP